MNKIHMTLQGKGGVGKSTVSLMLAQYLKSINEAVYILDTDPVNQTLTSYKALEVEHVKLMKGSKINERNFDKLMEKILTEKDATFVIDNGASSFVPLTNYIIENDVIDLLSNSGHELVFHIIIAGGEALLDTLNGFNEIATQTKGANIVVWVNEYFGEVEAEGKTFTEMKTYLDNRKKVLGAVNLTNRNPDTFGKDMEAMTKAHLTFAEIEKSGDFSIMAKQRLNTVKKDVFDQLSKIITK